MRSGCGKIIVKSNLKSPDSVLTEITSQLNTKSNVGSDRADRLTNMDSFC